MFCSGLNAPRMVNCGLLYEVAPVVFIVVWAHGDWTVLVAQGIGWCAITLWLVSMSAKRQQKVLLGKIDPNSES